MEGPQARWLPDGQRLHLHHGPIDLILGGTGPGLDRGLDRAETRFATILTELVAELPQLRAPYAPGTRFNGKTARAMHMAVAPFAPVFVTPMAAVAGAVADEVLSVFTAGGDLHTAYANNGGDVALYLGAGHAMQAGIGPGASGRVTVSADSPVRGIATSGWRGRSHSLGIADSVTVLAGTAARADAAATLIANAVDLPGNPKITREPARDLAPDSDLGTRRVTTHVAALAGDEIRRALDAGEIRARAYVDGGLITAALITLAGHHRAAGAPHLLGQSTGAFCHA